MILKEINVPDWFPDQISNISPLDEYGLRAMNHRDVWYEGLKPKKGWWWDRCPVVGNTILRSTSCNDLCPHASFEFLNRER